jgi:hypothetical protein
MAAYGGIFPEISSINPAMASHAIGMPTKNKGSSASSSDLGQNQERT